MTTNPVLPKDCVANEMRDVSTECVYDDDNFMTIILLHVHYVCLFVVISVYMFYLF